MDYISREDVIKLLNLYCDKASEIFDEIANLPAADVIERKTGKWRISRCAGGANCKCSNCKFEIIFSWVRVDPYNYCPNCGAKMEG